MSLLNPILTSANAYLKVTNFAGSTLAVGVQQLPGVPLTTSDGTATGALGVAIVSVGPGAGSAAPMYVLGAGIDNDPIVANSYVLPVGGYAVTGSTYAPAYGVGDFAQLAIDKDSGGLLCHIRTLTTTDAVTNTPVSPSTAATTAYAASLVIKNAAGRLFTLNGYNSKTSAQFIQIHNASALPSDTAIPLCVITVPAASNFSIDFAALGLTCSTGIVACNSSTGPTKTIGSADCYFTASYV